MEYDANQNVLGTDMPELTITGYISKTQLWGQSAAMEGRHRIITEGRFSGVLICRYLSLGKALEYLLYS
jgi:hypothetical protein